MTGLYRIVRFDGAMWAGDEMGWTRNHCEALKLPIAVARATKDCLLLTDLGASGSAIEEVF